jgi:restriction system protein
MNKIIDLTEEQVVQYINELYECFETGYDFEDFIKIYLNKLGLEGVVVTRPSRDGGIDLKAYKKI